MSVRVLRNVTVRRYGTPAQAAKCEEVSMRKIGNKMAVAITNSPIKGISQVALAVRAGSRYETSDNLGVSHVLRHAWGLTTCTASGFRIKRTLQKIGASIKARSDQNTIVYTLTSPTECLEDGLACLKAIITKPLFNPWEVTDLHPTIKIELDSLSPKKKLYDLLHNAAFRTGLGNSVYVKKYNLTNIGQETLVKFVNGRFKFSKMALVGLVDDPNMVVEFAECLDFLDEDEEKAGTKSEYYGGEIRRDADLPLSYVAIAGEGASANSKDLIAFNILRHVYGTGPTVRWGSGTDPISKAVPCKQTTQAKIFSFSHADKGLFGFRVISPAENVKEALLAVNEVVQRNITENEISKAKLKLQRELQFNSESTKFLMPFLVNQAVLLGSVKSVNSIVKEVESYATKDVMDAFGKYVKGKKSMVAYGDISNVPYLDQIN